MKKTRNGTIAMPADDKFLPTYTEITDMIRARSEMPVADFLVREIERVVQQEALVRWAQSPSGELRPDKTPETPRGLGEALWGLISSLTP